jgi:hypothetical protein
VTSHKLTNERVSAIDPTTRSRKHPSISPSRIFLQPQSGAIWPWGCV